MLIGVEQCIGKGRVRYNTEPDKTKTQKESGFGAFVPKKQYYTNEKQ